MFQCGIPTIGVGAVELGYLPHVTESETSVNAESEVKLSAAPAYRLPDLHELGLGSVQLPAQTLSTCYFDTQDLRLWRRRITLRHRVGEGDPEGIWTLKLQGEHGDNEDGDNEQATMRTATMRTATMRTATMQ